MVVFHSFFYVYQRVSSVGPIWSHLYKQESVSQRRTCVSKKRGRRLTARFTAFTWAMGRKSRSFSQENDRNQCGKHRVFAMKNGSFIDGLPMKNGESSISMLWKWVHWDTPPKWTSAQRSSAPETTAMGCYGNPPLVCSHSPLRQYIWTHQPV